MGGEPRAHGLALHIGEARIERVDRSELADQLDRGLLPHAGDAGHVVARVPHERQDVAHLLGWHAPFLDHLGAAHPLVVFARGRRQQSDAIGDERQHVLVARHQGDLVSRALAGCRERRHHVVGLDAGDFEHRQPQRVRQVLQRRDLREQVGRHGLARGLVVGVALVAKRGPRTVPGQRPEFSAPSAIKNTCRNCNGREVKY